MGALCLPQMGCGWGDSDSVVPRLSRARGQGQKLTGRGAVTDGGLRLCLGQHTAPSPPLPLGYREGQGPCLLRGLSWWGEGGAEGWARGGEWGEEGWEVVAGYGSLHARLDSSL